MRSLFGSRAEGFAICGWLGGFFCRKGAAGQVVDELKKRALKLFRVAHWLGQELGHFVGQDAPGIANGSEPFLCLLRVVLVAGDDVREVLQHAGDSKQVASCVNPCRQQCFGRRSARPV